MSVSKVYASKLVTIVNKVLNYCGS